MTIKEQLQSDEWRIRTLQIKTKRGDVCEECKRCVSALRVINYISGRKFWENPDGNLRLLCNKCNDRLFSHIPTGDRFLNSGGSKYKMPKTLIKKFRALSQEDFIKYLKKI